jgi:hypothetical protein
MFSKKGFNEMFWGLMVSDGGLQKRSSTRKLNSKMPQKPRNASFFLTSKYKLFCKKMKAEFLLHGFTGSMHKHSVGAKMRVLEEKRSKKYEAWRFETHVNAYFTNAYLRWYPNEKKIVDRSFTKLTPIMLAFWLMGDGSNTSDHKHKKYGSRKLTFSCESFNFEDQRFLVKELKKIGISSRTEKIRKNFRIAISQSKYVKKFLDIVKPHILSEFHYKLKQPKLKRESFTRHMTPKIKKLGMKNPKLAKEIVKKRSNEQRKKRYADDESGIAKKAKERAKKRYESMSQKEKDRFLKKLRDKRAKNRRN